MCSCDKTATPNYNDNELFCGGFGIQWGVHEGKCGICGDNWSDEAPRAHEMGGTYGMGKVVKNYAMGSIIEVDVMLTANHKGHFVFDLCVLNGEETEECFTKLKTEDGSYEWKVPTDESTVFSPKLQLPAGLECEHCVLRWTYVCGNSWGTCENGTGGMGCGPQEHFRSCSDISISKTYKPVIDWGAVCAKHVIQWYFGKNV